MKNRLYNIVTLVVLSGLLSVLTTGVLFGQTSIGTRIDNRGTAKFRYFGGRTDSAATNVASVTVTGHIGFTLRKTVSPSAVAPGDTLLYYIVIADTGVASLAHATVIDTVPSTLMVLSVTNGTVNGSVVRWNVPTLAPGGKDTLKITAVLQTNLSAGSVVTNKVFGIDSSGAMIVNSVDCSVSAQPRLDAQKTVSRISVNGGDSLTYTILVKNSGNTVITHVGLKDTLPLSISVIGISPNATVNGSLVTFLADSISMGYADTVRVIAVVAKNLPGGTQVLNTARVTSDQIPTVNSSAISTVIVHPALSVTKTALSDSAKYGDTLRYTISYRNTGNVTLTHLLVSDSILSQLAFISGSPAGSVSNNVYVLLRDSLSAGTIDSIVLFGRVVSYKTQGGVIRNTVVAVSDQTPAQNAQALVAVNATPSFSISKTVTHDTVTVGDTVHYSIIVRNTGTIPLTSVTVTDTLSGVLTNVVVRPTASVSSGVVHYTSDTLWLGAADTVVFTAHVAFGTAPNSVVPNRAWASAAEAPAKSAEVSFVTKASPSSNSCRLTVSAVPAVVRGDGVTTSVITAFYSDSAGHPKPDGTQILFVTPVGTFSDGRDTSVRSTVNGIAVDSLKLQVTGSSPVIAGVVVSASDSSLCYAADTVAVTFYPGAISGTVVNRKTGQPVAGATVTVQNSLDSVVGTQSTSSNGSFLIPIPASGTYNVEIVTQDQFHRTVDTKTTGIIVNLGGPGLKPPSPDKNSVSGRLYDPATNQPVGTAGFHVLLTDAQSHAVIDSTLTDSAGLFFFGNLSAGSYAVQSGDALRRGQNTFSNTGVGEYVLNVNIPLTSIANISLSKTGPSRAFSGDTVAYQIHFANQSLTSLTAISVIDTLDRTMNFVSATAGATYDASGHRVICSLPNLDSMSVVDLKVTVLFADTVGNGVVATNRVTVMANEIPQISAMARTTIFIPAKLSILKTVSSANATPGDTLSYVVTVMNISSIPADSIVISDPLTSQLSYISSAPAAVYDPVSGTLSWKVDSLSAGAQLQIKIVGRVRNDLVAGEYTFTNIANVRWPGGETNSSLNQQSQASVDLLVPFLSIHKQAVHRIVEIGDAAIYTIHVVNISAGTTAYGITISDIIPLGFRYIAGSSFRDSIKISDPSGTKQLHWNLADSLSPGASFNLTYRLVVGAGALDGNGINTAQGAGRTKAGSVVASNVSQDQVQINHGVFSDHGLVIGKVFYDDNENKEQDPGENGVKGIELLTEDGTRVTTGDDGKYSLPDVTPGEHVIRVRQASLPHGAELIAGYGEFAQEPSSRFVKVPESGIARADFYLRRALPPPASVVQKIAKLGSVSVRRLSSPKNILFVNDETATPVRLRGTQFDPGKAVLKAEAFPTLKAVADLAREFPHQIIAISGHTDSIRIRTKEFPSNKELSEARANAVKSYLVVQEHIDSGQISTLGFGETTPIAPHSTKPGRAQNRRVEITMSDPGKVFENYLRTVNVSIPLHYDGAVPVGQIELRDELDTILHFVPGSGRLGSAPVTPKIDNGLLVWTVTGVGTSYESVLSYRVTITIPSAQKVYAHGRTQAAYILPSGKVVIAGEAVTSTVIKRSVRIKPMNFTLPGALFEAGKAVIKPEAMTALKDAAEMLKNYPDATASVEGFTDSRPIQNAEFPSNVALSNARAKSVADLLIQQSGTEKSRISTYGWGELKPVASNETEKGRAANRWVSIRIYRSETITDSLRDDSADSSAILETRIDGAKETFRFDTSAVGTPGDRMVIEITVRTTGSRQQSGGVVVDSLPAGATAVRQSVRSVAGIDSVWTNGRIVSAKITVHDSVAVFRYTIELDKNMKPTICGHSVELIITSAGGKEFINRFTLPLVKMK